jgi:hypothetical protein
LETGLFVFEENRLLFDVSPLVDLEDFPSNADTVENAANLETIKRF